ncbi:MAG: type II toxin-antitoxin system RelE/ParE family toxin [Patescibacteria group bacterium]
MKRIKFVRDDIYDYLLSFDDGTVSKIIGDLELLDELGSTLGPPKSKKIYKNIYELKTMSNISIRTLYAFHANLICILHAFVKKSQKIPQKELKTAINRLKYLP